MRLPRSIRGWINLFWLTLRICPFCHCPLSRDFPLYDDGETVYCMREGGIILPRGFVRALVWNARAEAKETEAINEKGYL